MLVLNKDHSRQGEEINSIVFLREKYFTIIVKGKKVKKLNENPNSIL